MEELYRFGVSMEQSLIEKFDKLIEKKGYTNRSEAIRDLIRESLAADKIEVKNELMFGVISFIYNHHQRELEEKITDYQHHNYKSIVSTTHIHIDNENCLEIIILKEKAKRIKAIADKIFSYKGVKSGKLSLVPMV